MRLATELPAWSVSRSPQLQVCANPGPLPGAAECAKALGELSGLGSAVYGQAASELEVGMGGDCQAGHRPGRGVLPQRTPETACALAGCPHQVGVPWQLP